MNTLSKSKLRQVRLKNEFRKKRTTINLQQNFVNRMVYGNRKAKRRSLHLKYAVMM